MRTKYATLLLFVIWQCCLKFAFAHVICGINRHGFALQKIAIYSLTSLYSNTDYVNFLAPHFLGLLLINEMLIN